MKRTRHTTEQIIMNLRKIELMAGQGKSIQEGCRGKTLSPAVKSRVAEEVQEKMNVSERAVCKALSLSRSTKRYKVIKRDDEDKFTQQIIELATDYGR